MGAEIEGVLKRGKGKLFVPVVGIGSAVQQLLRREP